MKAPEFAMRLRRILHTYNEEMERAEHGDGRLDGPLELRDGRTAQEHALQDLRTLRSDVVFAEKQVLTEYSAAEQKAKVKEHVFAKVLFGRTSATRVRASHRRSLSERKADKLGSYREAKVAIDRATNEIKMAKRRVMAELNQEQHRLPRRKKRSGGAGAQVVFIDELERLADLHKNGGLDDDEFTAAKAKLLKG